MKDILLNEVTVMREELSIFIIQMNSINKTRELALAITKAEEAFMFLGKVKGALGSPSPYPKGKFEASSKIADFAEADNVPILAGLPILITKEIREGIQNLISSPVFNKLFGFFAGNQPFVGYLNTKYGYAIQAFMNLTASKMWLGMELNNIVQGESDKGEQEANREFREFHKKFTSLINDGENEKALALINEYERDFPGKRSIVANIKSSIIDSRGLKPDLDLDPDRDLEADADQSGDQEIHSKGHADPSRVHGQDDANPDTTGKLKEAAGLEKEDTKDEEKTETAKTKSEKKATAVKKASKSEEKKK